MTMRRMHKGAMAWLVVTLILGMLCILGGCAEYDKAVKHLESSSVGIERHIVLYASDGKVIREWTTKARIEDRVSGLLCFFDDKGKVLISGTFVVEEK
jgi:hypothetical protein